jgi:outer membrane lipoprotein SlyB
MVHHQPAGARRAATMEWPMRPVARAAAAAAVLATLLAACTPRGVQTGAASPAAAGAPRLGAGIGRIVSIRPVAAQPAAGTGDIRANVLAALGGGAARTPGGRGQSFEFIVRQDNGETVSVVQTNDGDFRPGQLVVLQQGSRTRLARAAPPHASGA